MEFELQVDMSRPLKTYNSNLFLSDQDHQLIYNTSKCFEMLFKIP